ncbi:MAG: ABC transporter ATP-binding protein, partial [Lacisediminihabitans sp.]
MSTNTPVPLSEDEKLELELAEQARLGADDWTSVKPGKAENFGKSFGRLLGLLKPHAIGFAFVSLLGAIGVLLSVIAPKVLGEATNIIFEGVISKNLPAGVTQAQTVEGLRSSGQTDLANMVSAMHLTPGKGVDFIALSHILMWVLALYVGSSILSWVQ